MIKLPAQKHTGKYSLEETISKRRSIRSYMDRELSIELVSQILWAAQGITDKSKKFRAAPSAGALYPMELYIATNSGLFHYKPAAHSIEKTIDKDIRIDLAQAAFGQTFIAHAGATIIITAVFSRITDHYGERGTRYVYIEAGHIAQNIHLQAVALGLGSVPICAFSDKNISSLLHLKNGQKPIYLVPVGYIKQ